MYQIDFTTPIHIHFIGIGGSGMFPLVQILHGMGYYITGSDNNPGDTIDFERQQMHIPVTIGQSEKNIEGADLIVHTAAIMDDNPELMAARASGVPTIERAELLGLIDGYLRTHSVPEGGVEHWEYVLMAYRADEE